MTKSLKWRLGRLPEPLELQGLVRDEIITKEEARQILFSNEEDRDKKSLESEIKFLRQLVDKLSNNTKIVETIREIYKPSYDRWTWYKPYEVWCSSIGAGTINAISGSAGSYGSSTAALSTGGNVYYASSSDTSELSSLGKNFSEIETF